MLSLVASVFLVFLIDRDGLRDQIDGNVSMSDVFYFTMVTITTVGYGDIVPVSDQARLIDAFFVTPVRIFVWLTFLGTAYQLIIQRLIEEWRMLRLQRELKDHVILCGYGHSGSIAAAELLLRGWEPEQIVVIDPDREEVDARGRPRFHRPARRCVQRGNPARGRRAARPHRSSSASVVTTRPS